MESSCSNLVNTTAADMELLMSHDLMVMTLLVFVILDLTKLASKGLPLSKFREHTIFVHGIKVLF